VINQVLDCVVDQRAEEWKINAWTLWVCGAAGGWRDVAAWRSYS